MEPGQVGWSGSLHPVRIDTKVLDGLDEVSVELLPLWRTASLRAHVHMGVRVGPPQPLAASPAPHLKKTPGLTHPPVQHWVEALGHMPRNGGVVHIVLPGVHRTEVTPFRLCTGDVRPLGHTPSNRQAVLVVSILAPLDFQLLLCRFRRPRIAAVFLAVLLLLWGEGPLVLSLLLLGHVTQLHLDLVDGVSTGVVTRGRWRRGVVISECREVTHRVRTLFVGLDHTSFTG